MQGIIESITRDNTGKVKTIVRTEDGTKNVYGVPFMDVEPGTVIEYSMVSGRSGYPYAKFVRFVVGTAQTGTAQTVDTQTGAAQVDTEDVNNNGGNLDDAVSSNHEAVGSPLMHVLPDGTTKEVPPEIAASVKTVTQATSMVKIVLQNDRSINGIWIKGEVANYTGHSYHYYFGIKDEVSLISCFMFENQAARALDFGLENGQEVLVHGGFDYTKTGKCSFIVDRILRLGIGDAMLRLEQLRIQLEREGLLDPIHHKEIPTHARRVGIVTSKDGKVIGDIQLTARAKDPSVQLILYHAKVQGDRAVDTIISGIRTLDEANVDVIIVGRGGGSDEELLIFSDERLIRAVFAAKTPIISAVGHADHRPILDDVADARVVTPTAAADMVVADVMSDIRKINDLKRHITDRVQNIIREKSLRLQKDCAELEKNSPEMKLKERKNRLITADQKLRNLMDRIFTGKQNRFRVLLAELNGLSPTAKLVGGFGYLSTGDKPITGIDDLHVGDAFTAIIHNGEISATVTGLDRKKIGGEQDG